MDSPKQQSKPKSLMDALRRWFDARGGAAESRDVDEHVAEHMPAAVMPMDAIRRKRQQMDEMDRMLDESR